ncbi:glutamate receptor 2.7-like isoform X1 [Neltuma alba]|uniref:glutamate receptor 2.7-like isoform X1 n=1 Tax=Neltuma alba TaxID=207710 RepID=UPI0010A3740C|nr:glutamate receptor 2.7-like isoform X1 [Prosopis alba]
MANPNYHFFGDQCVTMTFFAVLLLIAQTGAGDEAGSLILEGKKQLIVGVPKKCGLIDFVDLKLDSRNKNLVEKAQGYSIEVFNATIALLQNISVKYMAFANEDGSCVEDYNALLDQISKGKYGAVVGDVTIVANRSNYVDFTLPYTQSDVKILVKVRHDPRLDMWIFVRPFSWDLWLSIAVVCVFIGGIILFMERNVKQDSGHENSPLKKQLSGVSILWFPIVQAILPEKESLAKNCSRFVLVLWLILAFVLMQSYTACLSSILTVHQLQPRYPNEYDVLNDPNINIGYQGGSFIKGLLLERLKVPKSRVKNCSTIEQYKEALDKGSREDGVDAIFDEVPYIKVFLKKYGSNYAMIETRHRTDGFAFAFPLGSTLTSHFSRAILNMRESPKMDEIEHKYFGSSNDDEGQSRSNPSLDDDASPSSLTTYSFAGLFMLIGVFSLLALIVSENRIWRKPIMGAKMYIQPLLSRRFTRTNPLEEGSTRRRNNIIDGVEENIGSDDRANNQESSL